MDAVCSTELLPVYWVPDLCPTTDAISRRTRLQGQQVQVLTHGKLGVKRHFQIRAVAGSDNMCHQQRGF
jgi:hypothetical protein